MCNNSASSPFTNSPCTITCCETEPGHYNHDHCCSLAIMNDQLMDSHNPIKEGTVKLTTNIISLPAITDIELGNNPKPIRTSAWKKQITQWLTLHEVCEELYQLLSIAMPLILAGLLLYPRGIISMYFLGRLGELELAGGSLSIAFANITGYSVLYGLALGMEPICGQAYGAKRFGVMVMTTKRAMIGLMFAACPIAMLWMNMRQILLACGQDPGVTSAASIYIAYSLPDLAIQCILHPIRIYLRSQNITLPLSCCAALALPLHVLATILLVQVFQMGIRGVAIAAVWTNANMLILLILYLWLSEGAKEVGIWSSWDFSCLFNRIDWEPLIKLAIPSCVLVCLEWWWYELMIILSGLLPDAKATVATMGILIQITALVYIFPSSLSLAVSTRVSNELGAGRPARARRAVIVATSCGVVMGVCAMAFTTTIRQLWGRMFTSDDTILKLTALALPIIGLCELGNNPQTTGCGVLRGSARPSLGVKINLASFYGVGMPVSIGLVFFAGIGFAGLWFGLLAAQATCAISMLVVMVRTDWFHEAERSKQLTKMQSEDQPRFSALENISVVSSDSSFKLSESESESKFETEDELDAEMNEAMPLIISETSLIN